MDLLPIENDADEAAFVYGFFLDELGRNPPNAIGTALRPHLAKIMTAIGVSAAADAIVERVQSKVSAMMRMDQAQAQALVVQMPEPAKSAFVQLVKGATPVTSPVASPGAQ